MHKNAFVCSARTVFAKCFAVCAISLACVVGLAGVVGLACVVGLAGGAGFAYADEPQKTPEEILSSEDNAVNQTQVPDSSFLYDTSIDELAGADSYFDGQTVQVVGEVVGDRITGDAADDYCWIVLASPSTQSSPVTANVSVYMSRASSEMIDTFGAYGTTGTRLQVRGVFNLVCNEHQGISDIHASAVSLVSRGSTHSEKFDIMGFMPGIGMLSLAGAIYVLFRVMRERGR